MPIREYECSQCSAVVEKLMILSTDKPPVCPNCDIVMQELVSAPAIAKLATPAYGA